MSAHELIALGNGACIEASIFTNILEDYLISWPLPDGWNFREFCVSVLVYHTMFSIVLLSGPELPCIY